MQENKSPMATFSDIASRYRETSLVQASAGTILINLLEIPDTADILDVGCGTGNLTAELAKLTTGNVTGIDPFEAMISEASKAYPDPRIRFLVMDATSMPFEEEFDRIYCNSAFQWFRNPSLFLEQAKKALRTNGKIGLQAPAKTNYCPVFLEAINDSCRNSVIRKVFAGFRSPWFMLETSEAYSSLFRDAGFHVTHCSIEETRNRYSTAKVFDIFSSGAKAGYLNPACYDSPFPEGFETTFLAEIERSFASQADGEGWIDLAFYRIFLIASPEFHGRKTIHQESLR